MECGESECAFADAGRAQDRNRRRLVGEQRRHQITKRRIAPQDALRRGRQCNKTPRGKIGEERRKLLPRAKGQNEKIPAAVDSAFHHRHPVRRTQQVMAMVGVPHHLAEPGEQPGEIRIGKRTPEADEHQAV